MLLDCTCRSLGRRRTGRVPVFDRCTTNPFLACEDYLFGQKTQCWRRSDQALRSPPGPGVLIDDTWDLLVTGVQKTFGHGSNPVEFECFVVVQPKIARRRIFRTRDFPLHATYREFGVTDRVGSSSLPMNSEPRNRCSDQGVVRLRFREQLEFPPVTEFPLVRSSCPMSPPTPGDAQEQDRA